MTRLRVLHVITRLEPGGAQRNTLFTVAHLDRRRFAAGLAWGPGDPLDPEAEALADVARFPVPELVRPVRPLRDLSALGALRRVMRQFRPHVVHTHSSKAGILGRAAARLERVPHLVHSIHGFGFTPLQPAPVRALFLWLERRAAAWTDVFVAVSEANARDAVRLGLAEPDRVWVIRSGIELERFGCGDGSAARRALGVPTDAPLVVQVGNFKRQKAPLDAVRVAARVLEVVPEAWFVLTGDGPLRDRARALARRLGVAGRVLMPGWVGDVASLWAAADVALLTSRHEGLPRAVVEALASGVPVVATAVDGTPEAVRHGINGLLAPPGDVEELAASVVRLLLDRKLRARCAAAAPEGLDAWDIRRMVREQEELYGWLSASTR